MKNSYVLLLLAILFTACDDNKTDSLSSDIILTRSETEYIKAIDGNLTQESDPFELREIRIENDSAFITVSYSGGCRKHTFEVIWSEMYYNTDPPETGFIVIHNANDDNCEAYLTETLAFDLTELTGPVSYDSLVVSVLNGVDPSDSISTGGWNPPDDNANEVVFPEGDECQVEVTAGTVVCGAGLFDNTWLAMNDSVSSGNEGYYFRKWLQPVALSAEAAGFVPVPGKKYLIGARVQREHSFGDIIICLAWSGPSVPVRITCFTELE